MSAQPPSKSPARFLPILLIAAALALALAFGVQDQLSLDALYARAQELDAFVARNLIAALALYVLIYVAVAAISLPGAGFLTISGGFLFGVLLGGSAALIGATIGATLIFLAVRSALGEGLRAKAGGWLDRLREGFRSNAFTYLIILRLTPFAPFWAVNIASGVFNVKLRDFLVATALGMIPGAFVYAAVGVGLKAALQTGATTDTKQAAAAIFSAPAVYGPILGLIALSLVPLVVKALRRPGRAA